MMLKLQMAAQYMNSTSKLESICTAELMTRFTDSEWVHIPCDADVQFSSTYFNCERFTPNNITKVIVPRGHYCPTLYFLVVFLSCWTISGSHRGQGYGIRSNMSQFLIPFLSAWSLGIGDGNVIAVTNATLHTRCVLALGVGLQLVKVWRLTKCTHMGLHCGRAKNISVI